MINSILSFILLTSSCLAANPEITGTVSAVGKENIVVSVEGEVPAVKPGQTFTTKDGVKFTLKEIEGPMVVLTRPAQTELEIGDPITLTCKETNPAAEALLTKHEPEKTPEPLKAEPIPESKQWENKYARFLLGDGIGTTAGQSDNFFVWGARAGIDLSDSKSGTFSLGLNFETKNESLRVGSVSAEANMYLYEAEILSRRILGSVIYAGARAGIGVLSVDIKSPNLNVEGTGVSSVFGPVLGAEVPISKNVNFNLDFYWAHASKGNLDVGSTKYPYLKSSAILLQGGFVFDWR